ncbi:MAG: exopolysaccharide biosynthesis protein [Kiritimatiellia bacterium]
MEVVAEKTLREKMAILAASLPPESVTLSEVLALIGREGLLLFCVFLTLPFMVPVSIPGVSTVFGAVIVLIGISVVLNRSPWLPARLMKRSFSSAKLKHALQTGEIWLKRMEKISHKRMLVLATGPAARLFNGLMLILGAVLLMFPFGLVPLSNTLPGLAILFLAVGMLQEDGVCILLGYLTNLLTIFYFAFLILTGAAAMREAVRKIMEWMA